MKTEQLKKIFQQSLQRIASHKDWKQPSCIILSGGLDTCIIAEESSDILPLKAAFTTIASCTATDEQWASRVAKKAGLEHHIVKTDLNHLLELLPEVIRILKSFDPMELRNSLATFAAMKQASKLGFRCCVTGDGADEIFGGYSFTYHLSDEEFCQQRNAMISTMHFSSFPMGQSLGLSVFSPYLDPELIDFAKQLTKADNIGERYVDEKRQLFGKLLLRDTFRDVTSCWRKKDPIEVGSGTTAYGSGYFEHLIDNQSFSQQVDEIQKHDGVYIRDKEHLWYYRIFEKELKANSFIPPPRKGETSCSDPCPYCGYQLNPNLQTFCTTCGAYDRNLRSRKFEL